MNDLVLDAEASVTDRMVDGTIEHPRLRATLADIDHGAYAAQIALVRRALAANPERPLREALVEALSRIVAEAGVPVAMVQIVAMAFYRSTWQLLRRIDPAITLDGIRAMHTWRALAMMDGFTFGQHVRLPILPETLTACVLRLKRTLMPTGAAGGWTGPALPEGTMVVTADASEDARTTALRNAFFRSVFVDYLAGGASGHEHGLVIDALEAALEHPESMPFLRGTDAAQRSFRIAQIARTLVVMHDLACRLALHRERIPAELADAPITVQAAALAKLGVGATASFDHLLVECLYAEFSSLVAWTRETGPRLRIPRVVSAAPPPPTPTPVPRSKPAAAATRPTQGDTSSMLRPAVSRTLGISPFGWNEEPTGRVVKPAPKPVPVLKPAMKPPLKPVQQPVQKLAPATPALVARPVAKPPEVDFDKSDTEVIEEQL